MIKKLYLLLFYLALLFSSCKDSKKFDIQSDWQAIDHNDNYFEFFFEKQIVESFDEVMLLNPPYKYQLHDDSLKIGDIMYQLHIIDNYNVEIKTDGNSLKLTRLDKNDDEFYLSDLIDSKIFEGKSEDVWSDPILKNYFDSNFRIRETKKRIEIGQLNEDSLLNYWQEQSKLDTLDNSYFDFLIEKIKN